MAKCKNCGKETLPGKDYCIMCARDYDKRTQDNPYKGGQNYSKKSYGKSWDKPTIPDSCIFKDGFYADDGYLKGEIFIEAGQRMSEIFQDFKMTNRKPMTQTSIRHLFNMIKAIEMRLKADRNLPLGYIRENFLKFVTHTEYQIKRGVVADIFGEFISFHKDIAIKSQKEFKGFVQYLTSIVARMKQK